MPTFAAQKLVSLGRRIFTAAGAPNDIAELVAESLARANLVGHDSHGIMRTLFYVQQIRGAQLFPAARPQKIRHEAAVTVVDGRWGFGQLASGGMIALARRRVPTGVNVGCTHAVRGRIGRRYGR